ncbi:Spo0E family sporulation regulatory protein-aspartic acid phosphatase [Paraclostridium ghonii]|uniref:Spo0E family sporulation regulatory protein-aspartic acid phosphatase n=1 Tax=Paraclostridium ghonii TaxID=29358 RepID=UPI00202CE941|nr:Spo0E family sporulation regulatory protein-aspartic acid phosphatase [Paeniclostridium ghonii]MCM0167054.1 Spo0E family sporulation regulatory protein-aspartic acid phosphatase [Paeniclostridium ghonii]
METLRQALEELYAEFGHTTVTVKLSQILDRYVVEQQREELVKCKSNKKSKELVAHL